MEYQLTQHARNSIAERRIPIAWIERVLANPERRMADPYDAALEHRLGAIDEFAGRILRVVVDPTIVPLRVVTVYFDRGMKGKL